MDVVSSTPTITIENTPFRLEGHLGGFNATLAFKEIETNLHLIYVELVSEVPVFPKPLKLSWRHPIVDIQSMWYPGCNAKRWLTLPWENTVQSQATKEAPVICLHNQAGRNRLTFSCSDALNSIESTASIDEATAMFSCHLRFFGQPTAPLNQYRATIRLDQRSCPYYQSLDDVQAWWSS